MYVLFIISYAVRIFVFLSVINGSAAYARKESFIAAAKPETPDGHEARFVDASRTYVGTTEVYKPDAGRAGSLSHSGGVAIERKKRCILSMVAATGIAALGDYFDSEESPKKKEKRDTPKPIRYQPQWPLWPGGKREKPQKGGIVWTGQWPGWKPGKVHKGGIVWNEQLWPGWKPGKPPKGGVAWNSQQWPGWKPGKPPKGGLAWGSQQWPGWKLPTGVIWNDQKWPAWSNRPKPKKGVMLLLEETTQVSMPRLKVTKPWRQPTTTPAPKKKTTKKRPERTTTKKRPERTTKVTKPAPKSEKPAAIAKIPQLQKPFGFVDKKTSAKVKELGTIVVDGLPKHDIIHAIIVTSVTPKYRVTGLLILEFAHPQTGAIIHVPAIGGDEILNPQTGHRYLIYVDRKHQTYLILMPSQLLTYVMDITAMMEKYAALARKEKWGAMVIKGVPKYDLSKAIFITKREKKFDSDGNLIIHFVHPITGQKIQVPAEGGDQYVQPSTSSSFVIFVDVQHRTLLIFKGTDRSVSPTDTTTNSHINAQSKKWGSVVRQGVPKYDISRAIFVEKAETVVTFDGFVIMQFVHPITKQMIRIPVEGADEYTMATSLKAYVIFVDAQHRTLLISKGIGQSAFPNQVVAEENGPTKYIININTNEKTMDAKYGRLAKEKQWGSTAKGGVPKYDVSRAIFIERVDKVIDEDGFLVIQFVHPITKQTIRVPSGGADEYVVPVTGKVYVIFVDAQGRTLLIFKRKDRLAPMDGTHPEQFVSVNNININTNYGGMDANYLKLSQPTKWGSVVKGGVPKYSIPSAIFVDKVDRIIDAEGLLTMQFIHPITGQVIRTPIAGADEYVVPAKSKVYVIVVDAQGRTLLLFKGTDTKVPETQSPSNAVSPVASYTNGKGNINGRDDKKSADGGLGSIVFNGAPKYDISNAIFVMKTQKIVRKDGVVMLGFIHPATGKEIRVPLEGGDEYVMLKTSQVFIIFVDAQGRTLLILKGKDGNTIAGTTTKVDNKGDGKSPEKNLGFIVINGVPKYDITKAIFVMKTEKVTGKDGVAMLGFTHPIIGKKIQIPLEGGDEYVIPKTSQVFTIFVDAQGRTLLILKGRDNSVSTTQSPQNAIGSVKNSIKLGNTNVETTHKVDKKDDEKSPYKNLGSIVINGVPKYDITKAIFVMKTEKVTGKDGVAMLGFTHPIIGKKIQIPLEGGDEYVIPKTSQVFTIFVDAQGRTLLILKGRDNSVSTTQSPQNAIGSVKNSIKPGNTIVETTHKVDKKDDEKSPYKNLGSIVINGVPKYDITKAIFVMKTEKVTGKDGVAMLGFTHPIIGKKIQIPLEGGDEYVIPKTSQVFTIFVDAQGRTLLILKGRDNSVSTTQSPQNAIGSVKNSIKPGNTIVETTHKVDKKDDEKSPYKNLGSIVINGVPKYDITKAIFVMKTEKVTGKDGVAMLGFTHPIIGKKIQIPLEGGDEYVIPKTSQVFTIFVDAQGRTLLILKGRDNSVSTTQSPQNAIGSVKNSIKPGNTNVETTHKVDKKDDEKSPYKNLGSIVINGVPKYDLTQAIFVMEAEKMIGKDGVAMLGFIHPIISKKIQVPLEGGDEYVMPKTSQVFTIFVDAQGRTLLILKGKDNSVSTPQSSQNAIGSVKNNLKPGNTIVETTNKVDKKDDEKSPDKNLGSIVINGVPKYDLTQAIFVMEAEKMIGKDGVAMLGFIHPIIGKKIQVPLEGGDEYVMPKTSQVFTIFVDAQGRTLLILKGKDNSVSTTQSSQNAIGSVKNNIKPGNTIVETTNKVDKKDDKKSPDKNLGSIVINGVPKYDLTQAIFVMEAEKMIGKDGVAMLGFIHPIISKKIQVPLEGGDEYVMPKTSQVFTIFVDAQGRTLLILKGKDNSVSTPQSSQNAIGSVKNNLKPGNTIVETTNKVDKKDDEKSPDKNLGSIVINGVPKYDLTQATFVMQAEKMIGKDGVAMLGFTHPIIGKKIQVPLEGGDEYVMLKTSQVFIIFVDSQGRTLLILKGRDEKDVTGKVNMKYGTLVVGGRPAYDIPKALFVMNGKSIIGKGGIPMLHFVHPLTHQKIYVPSRGGDTYVDPKTSRIFLIFVDAEGRTLLILRDTNLAISPTTLPQENSDPASNEDNYVGDSDPLIKEYIKTSSKNKWGSIVIRGVPKYNLANAIEVPSTTKKILKNGFAIIEFKHPITGKTMHVPYRGTESYVNHKTSRAFVIFVDSQGRTLLIFKRQRPPLTSTIGFISNERPSGEFVWTLKNNLHTMTDLKKHGGSIVTGGVPENILDALRVTSTKKKYGPDGRTLMLEFVHPATHKKIQIPSNTRDVYVDPKTGRMYHIFVDKQGRTYLILKGTGSLGQSKENANIGLSSKFGMLVMNGFPSYDIKHAIAVLQTKRKFSSNGTEIIEFVHPKTRKKIAVPSSGGDVHIDSNSRKDFLIFVDRRGRTLLIFKKPKRPASSSNEKNRNDHRNDNVNVNTNVNENIFIPKR